MSSSTAGGVRREATGTASVPPPWLIALLTIDAFGSPVIGVALLLLSDPLAEGLGTASAIPIQTVGLMFVLNGAVNGWPARRPSRRSLVPAIAVDTSFGLVMLALALLAPADAAPWAGPVLALVGALSLALAAAKTAGRRTLAG